MTLAELHAAVGRIIDERPAAALNVVAVRLHTVDGPADIHASHVEVENRLGAAFVVAQPTTELVLVEAALLPPPPPPTTTTPH